MCQKSIIIRQLHHTIERMGIKKTNNTSFSMCTVHTKWLQATLIDKSDLQSFLFTHTVRKYSPPHFFFCHCYLLHTHCNLPFRISSARKKIGKKQTANNQIRCKNKTTEKCRGKSLFGILFTLSDWPMATTLTFLLLIPFAWCNHLYIHSVVNNSKCANGAYGSKTKKTRLIITIMSVCVSWKSRQFQCDTPWSTAVLPVQTQWECVVIENGSIIIKNEEKKRTHTPTQKNEPIGQMQEVFEWKRFFFYCYAVCCAGILLVFVVVGIFVDSKETDWKILREQCKQWSTNGSLC